MTVLHCCQRAVRRAWLCGIDPLTGQSFEHRKVWIQNRLQELARIFGVDCLSFSVMSNHLHVILRNRPDVVTTWSDDEVARRWWLLFPKRRNEDGTAVEPKDFEMKAYATKAKVYRVRLADISWWMRALAEPIARAANLEDDCRGRFWQGRFSSQKLTDEMAILACSWKAYIQLTEAEDAFRIQKSDLRIRPIWHHKEDRVLAHILVSLAGQHGSWLVGAGEDLRMRVPVRVVNPDGTPAADCVIRAVFASNRGVTEQRIQPTESGAIMDVPVSHPDDIVVIQLRAVSAGGLMARPFNMFVFVFLGV